MEHCNGFELTGIGLAHLRATGPRGGCAAWVGANPQADWRAREAFARCQRSLERNPRSTVPPAA